MSAYPAWKANSLWHITYCFLLIFKFTEPESMITTSPGLSSPPYKPISGIVGSYVHGHMVPS